MLKWIQKSQSFYLVVLATLISCGAPETSQENIDQMKPESFESFYIRFHKDSLFQIDRIKFPLPGINTDEMTVEDSLYFWNKKDWLMHNAIDTSKFFKKMFGSDHLVEEVITSNEPGVFVKRKFENLKGKWYL